MPKSRCDKYPNTMQLLEAEIFARRRSNGISQYALANKIGLSRNCIQQMECHEHVPKAETIFDIMKALEFKAKENAVFVVKYLNAYYQDREFQGKLEKE